ncbi:MAG: hypothetical protein ACO23H_06160 [Alphaproteobacteria bacterium]
MKRVIVKKAYLPTIDEARGVSLDDIEALRWIPERHRKTFAQPISVSRSQKRGIGQTIPWELDVAQQEHGLPLPGLLSEDKTGINPRRDVLGTWVGPSNIGTLLEPDFTFDPYKETGILLGTTESPHWWRTQTQGAKSAAGEGFQYGGFPKESFVEIPRPNNATPHEIAGGAFGALTGMNAPTPEMLDFLSQFPQEQGTHRWGQKMGSPLTEQQLIDQNLITPLSLEQSIVDSPFLPRKVASEPMDIAMRLLKEDPLHLQSSNTLARRAREELETDKMGENSPAYQEMMERMMEMYEPQDETIPLEDNLDQYAQETGKNPWRMLSGREMPNKHGGTAKVHLDPLTPIHPQQFYDWQAKNASEPMNIAFQLLKERVSPEAKRHKLEYDKKYESSPERVKYREELNRERRRRGIYGSHDHKDISHTEGGKLTLEGEHENRARHFKDKGTLREL